MRKTDSVLARFVAVVALVGATVAASCGSDDDVSETANSSTPTSAAGGSEERRFPDVVDVAVTADGDTYRFDVTISSPYDTPDRYADAWRIVAPDGTELGVRELTHDHAGEQPFTRSLTGVVIPADVATVTVEGRDSTNGWGGGTKVVTIPR